jgi:peptidoglycan-associated lipoprotein
MKKQLVNLAMLLGWTALALSSSSCCRSRSEVWEDTKTCGRYVGKGMRSLFGQHVDSRDYANFYERWEDDPTTDRLAATKSSEFIPLSDSGPANNLALQDFPISRESPGDPGSPIPGIDKFTHPTGELAALFNNIHFDTDSYTIQGSENIATLRKIADFLAAHPHLYIFVEGHADERGAAAYNLALGARRSNAVRNFLIQHSVDPDRLFTISYGLERPLAQGHDESSWKQNRRAQFKLYDR